MEKPVEHELAQQQPRGRWQRVFPLRLGAGHLEKPGVIDSGGTRRFAGQAAETEIHFVGEGAGGFEPSVGDGPHQGDASARAVAFEFGGVVSGASGQTEAAVHALLDDRVIQPAQLRKPGGGQRDGGGRGASGVLGGRP